MCIVSNGLKNTFNKRNIFIMIFKCDILLETGLHNSFENSEKFPQT